MSLFDRLLGILPWLLAAFFAAAAVHFVSILAMPRLAPDDAFSRLEKLAPLGKSIPLSPTEASKIPFADPALAQAVCFYDVGNAPLRVHADVPPGGFTGLSLRSRDGRVFYAMTDRAALDDKFDALVLTQAALDRIEATETEDAPQELRIVSPTDTGIILVETLVSYPSARPAAQAILATMSCRSEQGR